MVLFMIPESVVSIRTLKGWCPDRSEIVCFNGADRPNERNINIRPGGSEGGCSMQKMERQGKGGKLYKVDATGVAQIRLPGRSVNLTKHPSSLTVLAAAWHKKCGLLLGKQTAQGQCVKMTGLEYKQNLPQSQAVNSPQIELAINFAPMRVRKHGLRRDTYVSACLGREA